MGGLYDFGRCSTANLRQKDSAINNAVGGAMAGGVLGVACTCTFISIDIVHSTSSGLY